MLHLRSPVRARQLLNRAAVIDRDRMTADCVRGFGFLANLTDDERTLAQDKYQREQAVADRLRARTCKGDAATHGVSF